jgi:hypothetical protein
MNAALQGALIGLGIGAFLVFAEYMMLNKAVHERADKLKRKAQFDETERRRIHSILRFALALPPAFALIFWWVWG